jgi:hypothetical protein
MTFKRTLKKMGTSIKETAWDILGGGFYGVICTGAVGLFCLISGVPLGGVSITRLIIAGVLLFKLPKVCIEMGRLHTKPITFFTSAALTAGLMTATLLPVVKYCQRQTNPDWQEQNAAITQIFNRAAHPNHKKTIEFNAAKTAPQHHNRKHKQAPGH